MITFNNIVERFKIFAENHFFVETFSFGSPDDVDLTKFTSFPLMHLVYTGATYDPGTKTYNLEIYILDLPADKTAKVDRQKEVVSDAEQCAEDIIADIKNGGNIFLFAQDYEVVNATTTPLEEETKNVLSGVLLDLSVSIPYEWDACNAPIDGVEPGGTEVTYARRGVLRMLTLDGATDVPSVRTIKVTNGTLTDDGDGVVTLDTGGVDTLAGLTDVDVTGVTDGQVLKYDDATGEWIPANDQSATSLGNLDDVSLATPSNREALIYDGDNWVNDNVTKSDVGLGNVDNTSDADKPVSTATQTALDLKANTADVPTELNDLSDVSLTTPTGNQALIYNATASAFQALPSYTNRFEDEAEQAASDAVTGTGLFIERYYSAKADGDGIFIDAQSDTPATGKKIVRKIYQIQGGLNDTTVTGWTLLTTFADDTAYSATVSTFDGYRDGDTYGTPPFTLAQTWEEQTAPPAFTGLLNETYGSGAAAAYGTRRLNGNYTGACMTIRRASDGTTTTIGFDGEDIDEAAIETFCTGTTCTVQVWHDQSQSGGTGSGNDATQTTPANQPTIYTGGALVKEGGRLALDFDGSNDTFATTYQPQLGTASTADLFTFAVSSQASSHTGTIWRASDGNSRVVLNRWNALSFQSLYRDNNNINVNAASSALATNQQYLLAGTLVNGTVTNYVDGTTSGTSSGSFTGNIDLAAPFYIGSSGGSTERLNGNLQELVFYSSDKSTDRTSIEGNISAYYQSAKLLNEAYGSGAAAAYSVRQLNRDYTGAALQVERSSDNTTQDIGFDANGDLDESALTTFCTGTTCRVRTWYDQATAGGTGSGNDAQQTDHTKQPTIYTGGAIVKENGRVAVDFDGSNNTLTMAAITTGTTHRTSFTVAQSDGPSPLGQEPIYTLNDTVATGAVYFFTTESAIRVSGSATYSSSEQISQSVSTLTFNGTTTDDITLHINGISTTQATSTSTTINTGSGSCQIGSNDSFGTAYLDGTIQELIFYNSDKSTDRTSIESNVGDYFTQNTPLLDTYTGAAAAYSLRKLRTAYTGSAIRVRRASDNTEQDIGFNVFGELDTVSLTSFCSGTNGFVRTFYDQSGNGNDLVQTTTSKQPQIYDGSTGIITQNGKPILRKVSDTASMRSSYDITTGGDRTVIMNHTRPVNSFNTNATTWIGNRNTDLFFAAEENQQQFAITDNVTINSAHKNGSTWSYPTVRANLWNDINGQNLYFIDATFSFGTNGFCLGFNDGAFSYAMMDTQEIIIYESDQSTNRTNIESNINTFYSIY